MDGISVLLRCESLCVSRLIDASSYLVDESWMFAMGVEYLLSNTEGEL